LNGGHDNLVGVIIRQKPPDERSGVGVFFDALRLEAVELFARLPVEVFAINHEQDFLYVGVVFEQGGGLERGECFSAAGGVPYIAVATVFFDGVDDGFDRVNLVRPHHHHFFFGLHQHHVLADHLREGALAQEGLGELEKVGYLFIFRIGPAVDGQVLGVGVERKVLVVVVGEIQSIAAVANDKQLHKGHQRVLVAVARVFLVFRNLLHGPTGAYF